MTAVPRFPLPGQLLAPGRVGVKICGVTNAADAEFALAAGADALGINLFPGSKRFVPLAEARAWVADLPVTRVAVVVNASAAEVAAIAETGCFDAIQFHGDESPAECATSPLPWLRAARVSGPDALAAALAYASPYLLLDAHSSAGYGGTGARVDPELAAPFIATHPERRVILAGGLRPETVAASITATRPAAVDVASGVETDAEPRRKDPARVRAFLAAVRGV